MATTKKAAPKEGAKKTEAKPKDAPRIKRKDLDVKPIAPVEGDGCDQSGPEIQNFAWAARQIQNGLRVKREAWIGNKYLEASGAPRNVLTNEDMLATDWIIA